MSRLSWISDAKLHSALEKMQQRAKGALQESSKRMEKNIIDPFSALFIASIFDPSNKKSIINLQAARSAMQGISNALGDFHQNILSSVKGWENYNRGYDLRNESKKIMAEIKNKHNTMNASNRAKVIESLGTAVQQAPEKNWKAYLVIVIPKRSERYKNRLANREIFEIDGASFYEMATGKQNALHELFDVLLDGEIEKVWDIEISESVKSYCSDILSKALPPRL